MSSSDSPTRTLLAMVVAGMVAAVEAAVAAAADTEVLQTFAARLSYAC